MEEAAEFAQAVDRQGLEVVAQGLDATDGGLGAVDGGLVVVEDGGLKAMEGGLGVTDGLEDAMVSNETWGPEVAIDQEQFCDLDAVDNDDDDLPVPQPDSEEDYDQEDDDDDLPVLQPDSEEDYDQDEIGTQDLEEQSDLVEATIQHSLRRSGRLASLPRVNYKETANRTRVPLRRSPRLARLLRVNYKV